MGAHPKRKISTVQRKTRQAAQQLTLAQVGRCSHCGAPTRPHHMCAACGYYKGRPVVKIATDK